MTHCPTPHIQPLSKSLVSFTFKMDLGFDHFSPSQLPLWPRHHHLAHGLPVISKLVSLFSLFTPTVYSQQQPEVVIYQNVGLIMSLLCSKLSRCFCFSKGKKNQTLKMAHQAPYNPHLLPALPSTVFLFPPHHFLPFPMLSPLKPV